MYDYETSEQLFIDIWKKYGSLDEVDDADIIFNILNDSKFNAEDYLDENTLKDMTNKIYSNKI